MYKGNYLVFVIVVGCGYFYMFSDGSGKTEVFSYSEKFYSSSIGKSNRMDSVASSVEGIETRVPQPTLNVSLPEEENVDPEIPPVFDAQDLAKAKEVTINRSATIDQRFAQDSSKPIVEVMDELFQEESIDAEWAYMNEKNIHNFFVENVKFSNFSPDSIQCKSRSCQVIISSSDKKTGDDIRADITQQILETNANIPTGIMSVIDPETAKLIIYFQEDKI